MTGPWPAPFAIALALLSVAYLVRSGRRAFRHGRNALSDSVPSAGADATDRLARFERMRIYALGGGVVFLSLPLLLTLLTRPPQPKWLVLVVIAIPLAFFATGIVLSFIIGWLGGWRGMVS